MDRHSPRAQFSWCLYDWANSAFATVILAAVLPVYFVALVPETGAVLPFLPEHRLSAASLWGYSISLSMLGLAFAAPALGALADRRAWHKQLLILFWLGGCLATAELGFSGDQSYLFVALLFIGANFCFAGANIFYNAYLPLIAPAAQSDRLSARGFAFGYVGGGLLLALVFLLILHYDSFGFTDRGAATRFGFLMTAGWWFCFTLPTLIYLPRTTAGVAPSGYRFSLRNYINQFKQLRRYPDLTLFLFAFLCYNDGIQTIISVSAVYARGELGLGQGTIIGCFLMIQFLAMPGALLFARLSDKIGTARAILLSLATFLAVCLYAYRMESALEFWLLGAVIALILGGSQALSRSLYASLVPPAKSAEFFGFYTISSRFATIFGPLLFALVTDLSGSSRNAILSIGLFFIVGAGLLSRVQVERGRALAARHPD